MNPNPLFVFFQSSILRYGFLLLLALPFFCSLTVSSVWDANEAFYVQTPREMVEQDNWLVPHFNGEPRLNKPPLAYWLIATFYKYFTVSIFWERLAMAVLSYGTVLAVFVLGKILYEETVGFLAAGIFATTFRFLILARRLLIDVLVLFCVVWAIVFFILWLRGKNPRHFIFCSLFFGLGFLSKGPVALIPVIFLGIFLLVTGKLKELLQAPFFTGTSLFLLLSSSWFLLLGTQMGWSFVSDFFLQENIARFSSVSFGPQRGFFFFIPVFFGDFFPWSFLFPFALLWAFRRSNDKKDNDWFILLALWIGVYFFLFSISYNKQEYYILPLYPAASIWIAYYLSRGGSNIFLSLLISVFTLIFSVLIFFISSILFEGFGLWIPLVFIPMVLWALFVNRPSIMIAGIVLFYSACFIRYLEPLEKYKPVQFFAQTINRTIERGENIQAGYFGLTAPSLTFYLDKPILEINRLGEAVQVVQSPQTVYLIVPASHYQRLVQAAGIPLKIVEVRSKLYTTMRTLISGFKGGQSGNLRSAWIRPVYLITNRSTD